MPAEAHEQRRTAMVQEDGRLDQTLVLLFSDLGRRSAKLALQQGRVFVNGQRCRVASRWLLAGTRILLHPPLTSNSLRRELEVLFEDNEMLVLNKPPGWTVNSTETSPLTSVVEHFADRDARVVHRLDRDTSGVLVLAKGRASAAQLSRDFAERKIGKIYWAIVEGSGVEGTLTQRIGRDRRRPRARTVASDGQTARTDVRLLQAESHYAWVEARPVTGRTHQIRVHLSHVGAPIVGDTLYGAAAAIRVNGEIYKPRRPMLHALELRLANGAVFHASPPEDFKVFFET